MSACLILCDSFGYASTNSLQTPDLRQQTQAGFLIPAEFGTVEESAAGNSGKTVFYLQDAHDSLEAQENIAKMIDHLVSAAGVKTVFEEGYAGPVPTDEYFGQIENPDTKEKASYFLMDRLRLGGAEYSHINRQLDWKLIGADDLELHLENIEAYRKTASRKASVLPELNAIREDLQTLINRDFPPDVREWLKTHRLFTAGKMELTDYLGRALPLWKAGVALDGKDFAASYPQLALLEAAAQPGTQDGAAAAKRLGEIDPKRLFSEMENAEEAFAAAQLKDEKTKTLFHCVRMIGLLERLFDFKLTSSEYAAVREEIRSFDTRRVAGLLSGYTGSPVFLTRRWEILAREAVRFYEIARKRDEKIGQQLDAFVRDPEEKTAVIVFGGFHKDGLKTLLRERGLAYEIITPKISGPSERHQQYYKQLMAAGRLPFETKRGGEDAARLSVPQTVAKAASNERMWTVPEDAALLPAIVQSIEAHPGLDRASLALAIEQHLLESADFSRAETRTQAINDRKWAELSRKFSALDNVLDAIRRRAEHKKDQILYDRIVRIRERLDAAKNARIEKDFITLGYLLQALQTAWPADERFADAHAAFSAVMETYGDIFPGNSRTENQARSESRSVLDADQIRLGSMKKDHIPDIFGRMRQVVEYRSRTGGSEEADLLGLFTHGSRDMAKGLTADADGKRIGALVYEEDDWGIDVTLLAVDPKNSPAVVIEKLIREMMGKLTDEKPMLRLHIRESNEFARGIFTSMEFGAQLRKGYYDDEDGYEMTYHKPFSEADGTEVSRKFNAHVRNYNAAADLERVARIEVLSHLTPGKPWDKELLQHRQRYADLFGFTAEIGGEAVGYLFYRSHFRETATPGSVSRVELEYEIEKFNVHPDFRGRGIEMYLLDRLKDELQRKNSGATKKTIRFVVPEEVSEGILSHSREFLSDMDFTAAELLPDHFGEGRDGIPMIYQDSGMWVRRVRFMKLLELMLRNDLVSQDERKILLMNENGIDRQVYFTLGGFQFETQKKIARDILRNSFQSESFARMRENRPADEALLYRLAGYLGFDLDISAEFQNKRSEVRDEINDEDVRRFSGRLPNHQHLTAAQAEQLRKAVATFQTMLATAGKGEVPSQKEILDAIIETNLTHPYRLEHDLPPTVVFDGAVFRSYYLPGEDGRAKGPMPYRIAVTFADDFIAVNVVHMGLPDYKDFGVWKDPNVIKYPISEDFDLSAFPISKGGVRWYHEGRKPLQGISFEQKIAGFNDEKKKTTNLLLEATNLSASMLDKNPPADVLFGGGKTVILTRQNADIQKTIFNWVASSITAGVLGKLYLAGPDMATADLMGVIQAASDKVRIDLGLAPIPITTSIGTEPASFNHELWTVTSISDVESFLAAWSDREIRERYKLPEGTSEDPLDIVIQGYGDVGTGIVKYLLDQYGDRLKNGSIRIVAISNMNGGVYRHEGLDIGELIRFRNDPTREQLVFFNEYLKDNAAAREGLKRLAKGEDVFYVRELDTDKIGERKPIMAFPAAGPNVFNTGQDIERLKNAGVRSVCSAANNVLMEGAGLDKKLEELGILYLDARLVSPGGIYASTEEIYHQLTEGIENVRKLMVPSAGDVATPEDPFYKHHIQGGIAELANSVTRWVIEEFKKSLKNGKTKTISAIHQELSELIRGRMNYLLKVPSPALLKRVNRDLERIRVRFDKISVNMTDKAKQDLWNWIARIEILNTVTEIARSRIMYHEDNIPDLAEAIEAVLQTPPAGRPHVSIQRALVYNLARMPAYGFWGLFLDVVRNAALDPRVRANAAEALGLLNEKKAAGALKVLAEEEGKSFVGSWIRWSLQKIESEDPLAARAEARQAAHYLKKFDWVKMGDIELLGLLKNVRDELEKMQIRLQEIRWLKSTVRPGREPFSLFQTTLKSFLFGLASHLGKWLGARQAGTGEEKWAANTAKQKQLYAEGLFELAARWQNAEQSERPVSPEALQAFVREAYAVRQGIKNFDLIMKKTEAKEPAQQESRNLAFLEYAGKNAVDFLKKMADHPDLDEPFRRDLVAIRAFTRQADVFIGDGLDRFFAAYRDEYARVGVETLTVSSRYEARVYPDEDGKYLRVDMSASGEGTVRHFLRRLETEGLRYRIFLAGPAVRDFLFGVEPDELGVLVSPNLTDGEREQFTRLIGSDEKYEGIPVTVLGSPLEFQESADDFPDLSINRFALTFDSLSHDPILNDFTGKSYPDFAAKLASVSGLDFEGLVRPDVVAIQDAIIASKIPDWVDQMIRHRLTPSVELRRLLDVFGNDRGGYFAAVSYQVQGALEDYQGYLDAMKQGRRENYFRKSLMARQREIQLNRAIERVIERIDPGHLLDERVRINVRLFLFGTVSYGVFANLLKRNGGFTDEEAVQFVTWIRDYFGEEMARSEARLPIPSEQTRGENRLTVPELKSSNVHNILVVSGPASPSYPQIREVLDAKNLPRSVKTVEWFENPEDFEARFRALLLNPRAKTNSPFYFKLLVIDRAFLADKGDALIERLRKQDGMDPGGIMPLVLIGDHEKMRGDLIPRYGNYPNLAAYPNAMDFSHFPDELLMLLRQVPGKRELRGHKLSEDDLAKKRSRAFASEMFMNEKPRKPNSEEVKSSDHAVASDVLLPLYDELSRYVASGARIHLELEAPRGPEFFQAAVKVRIEELEWDGANHDRFIIHLTELLSLDGDPASKKMVQLIAKGRIVVVANKPKEGEFAVIAHSSLSGEARLPVPNEQARSENREAGDAMQWPLADTEERMAVARLLSHQLRNKIASILSGVELLTYPNFQEAQVSNMSAAAANIANFLEAFSPQRPHPFFLTDYMGMPIVATPQTESYGSEYQKLLETQSSRILTPAQVEQLAKAADFPRIETALRARALALKEKIDQLQTKLKRNSLLRPDDIRDLFTPITAFHTAVETVTAQLSAPRSESRSRKKELTPAEKVARVRGYIRSVKRKVAEKWKLVWNKYTTRHGWREKELSRAIKYLEVADYDLKERRYAEASRLLEHLIAQNPPPKKKTGLTLRPVDKGLLRRGINLLAQVRAERNAKSRSEAREMPDGSVRASLSALHSASDKLILMDFRDMTDPKEPFSEAQLAEVFGLAEVAVGKVKVLIHDADVAHDRYGELKALIAQMERKNPKLRGKIILKTESLTRIAKTDIAAGRGQVLYLFKNTPDLFQQLRSAGLERKILRFRYEDETGRLTRSAGTLGYAVTVADEISKKTADLLKQQLPEGVRFNPRGGYYYVNSVHAGIWEKIYGLMYVVVFARSA